jgi:hypothetical protein
MGLGWLIIWQHLRVLLRRLQGTTPNRLEQYARTYLSNQAAFGGTQESCTERQV